MNESSPKEFFSLLKNYWGLIIVVALLSATTSALSLLLPRIIARAIDKFAQNPLTYTPDELIVLFGGTVAAMLIIGIILTILSNQVSEKIAADIRTTLAEKVAQQSYRYVQKVTVSKILTNATSDADAVKNFITQGIVIIFSSILLLFGSAISLLTINWQLALPIIAIIPILFGIFAVIFARINKYFIQAQEIIDRLNTIINETIVGAALIRVLNSKKQEMATFGEANNASRAIGIKIVSGFALLIPIITLLSNVSVLLVLGYGGVQVIDQSLSPGNFAAFFNYVGLFITPIILLGFLGSVVTRAFASYGRIHEIIAAPIDIYEGEVTTSISGEMHVKNVSLIIDNQAILNNVSMQITPGTRTAIIGPTAAGKTQLFNCMIGLLPPTEGEITLDSVNLAEYKKQSLYAQIGLVFQDSVLFNTSIRENIQLSEETTEEDITQAIAVAELDELIASLPEGLDTVISERGASLSGGQKQRLTLARALARKPRILFLDDFTARVDIKTEKQIFENIAQTYPDITIVSITQKIEPIKDYDQIILLMEGEIVATGKHTDLLQNSFEYKQIYTSQQSVEE